jgi:hypothetical protein
VAFIGDLVVLEGQPRQCTVALTKQTFQCDTLALSNIEQVFESAHEAG